jgi:hypothetical protein
MRVGACLLPVVKGAARIVCKRLFISGGETIKQGRVF